MKHSSQYTKSYYNSVFMSDFHIGAKQFDAKAALQFLQSFHAKKLYLVGDIIDGWKLKKRWHWTEDDSKIIDELIHKHDTGTKIIFLPGNHDEELRHLMPALRIKWRKFKNFEIHNSIIHKTAQAKKMLVLHGDQFDRKILQGPLSRWSDIAYDWLLDLLDAHQPPEIQIGGENKKFSLAKYLNRQGQRALSLLNNFETMAYKEVKRKGLDGLICGHTHIPVLKTIKDITYANCGDWLRTGHCALVEHKEGELELIDWPCSFTPTPLLHPILGPCSPNVTIAPDRSAYRTRTEKVIQLIHKIWQPVQEQKMLNAPLPSPSFQSYPQFTVNHLYLKTD